MTKAKAKRPLSTAHRVIRVVKSPFDRMAATIEKGYKWRHLLFVILWLAGIAFLVWKAQYGYGNRDECFYLTVPKRLCEGDSLLTGEWHVSQLAGTILYPVMKLYLLFNPSFEGALLHFRYIFIAFQAAVSLAVYGRLSRRGTIPALCGSLLLLLYAPFNIMALSYNSMGIGFFALATSIFVTAEARPRLDMLLAGVFYALSVLCCPYLAVLWVLWGLATAVAALGAAVSRSAGNLPLRLSGKAYLFFTIGIAVPALAFMILLFSRATTTEVLSAIPKILDDPEHSSFRLLDSLRHFRRSLLTSNSRAHETLIFTGILGVIALVDRRSGSRKALWFCLSALVCIYYALGFREDPYVNFLMLPLGILGLESFLLTEKRDRAAFYGMFLPSLFYSYAICSSSNQAFYVISSAFTVGSVISLVFVGQFLSELSGKDPSVLALRVPALLAAAASFLTVFVFFMQIRSTQTFWDSDVAELDTRIGEGLNRGITTTEYYARADERIYKAMEPVRQAEGENILYFSKNTGLYLLDGKHNAAFSAWMSLGDFEEWEVGIALDRLCAYYELNPDKFPDVVFVDRAELWILEAVTTRLGLEDWNRTSNSEGYLLLKEAEK